MASLVLLIVGVLLLVASEPIGFALSIGTLAAQAANGDSLLLVPQRLFNGANNFPLVAIPLFIMTGQLMNGAGISRRLIAFASSLIGFVRGGLAHANVIVNMIMAEMSGSAVADAAALGTIMIPAMRSKGYPANFAVSLNSSAASIAIIIPPSIPMILYAVTAETSVTQLFIAGFVPGILMGLAFTAVAAPAQAFWLVAGGLVATAAAQVWVSRRLKNLGLAAALLPDRAATASSLAVRSASICMRPNTAT